MNKFVSRRRFLQSISGFAVAGLAPSTFVQLAQAMPSDLAADSVRKALAGDFAAAGNLAKQSGDQAAIKFVELLYLRDHGPEAGYARIMAFFDAAPNWPLTETLLKRAEKALYDNKELAPIIAAHFQNRNALTAYGLLVQARQSYVQGDVSQGKEKLRAAWGDPQVDAALEQKIRDEFSGKLTNDDHKYRFSRLIYAQEANAAIRQARNYLSGEFQKAAGVAQGLINFRSGADKQYAALPSTMRSQLALQYVLARYYRKFGDFDKARGILVSVPADAATMGDAAAWFEERRTTVRRSIGPLQSAHWKAAYQIARNHGLASGDLAVDGEFLAGWVALRYLSKPEQALVHFLKLQKLAQNGTDRARASYWIGRTHKAGENVAAARLAFQAAATQSTLYYGQLAREELGRGRIVENVSGGTSTAAAKSRVEQDEVVRALRIVSKVGAKTQLPIFMMALATRFQMRDDLNAVAEIVQDAGGTTMALRFAKAASMKGHDIEAWAYPIYGLPSWAALGKPVEKALVFALSRQESEFDPNAGSSVGAQGLMQLMPGTARIIARQYHVGYSAARLKEASYNVQLGSAHLADLVGNLNGSYILTLVAYNAGPRRAQEWVAYYGDPRGGQVDPVDWVESIPFNETRQYVQKVMQNLHVYRSRLAPSTVAPMTADLKRGTPQNVSVASTSPATSASN